MNINDWVKNNLFKDNKIIPNRLRLSFFEKTHPNEFNLILDKTSFLSEDSSIPERIYYLVNNLNSIQKCSNNTCNNRKKFLSFNYGLQIFCCKKCAHKDENSRKLISEKQKKNWLGRSKEDIKNSLDKRKETCIKKYGVTNVCKSEDIKNKISNTLKNSYKQGKITSSFSDPSVQDKCKTTQIEKYGSVFFASDIGKEKIKKSNVEKYNVENVFSNPIIQEKIKNTHLERRGVSNPQQDESVRNKTKETCLQKYGSTSALSSKELREKGMNTMLARYGVSHPMYSDEIKNKLRNTCRDNYGVDSPAQIGIPLETLKKLDNVKWLKEQHYELKKPTSLISKEIGVSETLVSKRMHKLGMEVKRYGFSQAELEIIDFIKTQNIENIKLQQWNIVSGKEIDIYLPEYNLAIEYDGLYWHSEEYGKTQNYHLNKTKQCIEKNIQLLHIFENEWLDENKKDIWKSILISRLNKSQRIYARRCKILEISNNQCKDFLYENHLQGNTNSSIKYGLFYNEKLVSVMTFSKPRYSNHEWEIIRFCNKKYTNVIGGASKLFKYFVNNNNPQNVISYSDRRIGEGKVYDNLGFEFEHSSSPNYFYFKPGSFILHSRIKFQKHKLNNLLEVYDENKTEHENMYINGYYKIWDCGNNVYTWDK